MRESMCNSCVFDCNNVMENVKSCSAWKVSGEYVENIEKQNAKLIEALKAFVEINNTKYYEVCDFMDAFVDEVNQAEKLLDEVKNER